MSLDRSLKSANSLVRHRNVLTRAERLEMLKEDEKWDEAQSVYGLPKVAHRKAAVAGKSAKEESTEAGAEGTPAAGAAAAAGSAAAPGAKGAAGAPAKGAAGAATASAAAASKAGAPAAKGKK